MSDLPFWNLLRTRCHRVYALSAHDLFGDRGRWRVRTLPKRDYDARRHHWLVQQFGLPRDLRTWNVWHAGCQWCCSWRLPAVPFRVCVGRFWSYGVLPLPSWVFRRVGLSSVHSVPAGDFHGPRAARGWPGQLRASVRTRLGVDQRA